MYTCIHSMLCMTIHLLGIRRRIQAYAGIRTHANIMTAAYCCMYDIMYVYIIIHH